MKSEKIQVHLIIGKKPVINYIGKNITDDVGEWGTCTISLEIKINGDEYANSEFFDNMECAVIDLHKQLPAEIYIECCQTCKYGNYCPFGNCDNEIFCLKGFCPKNKMDVAELFTKYPDVQPNTLLYWCCDYERVSNEYYSYNNWTCAFDDKN